MELWSVACTSGFHVSALWLFVVAFAGDFTVDLPINCLRRDMALSNASFILLFFMVK